MRAPIAWMLLLGCSFATFGCSGPEDETDDWDSRIGAWVRRLQVQSAGAAAPCGMAWSMINWCCEDRSLALQYALMQVDDQLTDAHLAAALAGARIEMGSLSISGPLALEQTLLAPDGEPYAAEPIPNFWPYHSQPAVRVAGEWRVLDLSLDDQPIEIDRWIAGLVDAAVSCERVESEDDYLEVWSYWNTVWGSVWDPPPRPARLCAYKITAPFTFRQDQQAEDLFDAIRTGPETHETQFGAFETVTYDLGIELSDEDVPLVRSRYAPVSEDVVCTWQDLRYCDQL